MSLLTRISLPPPDVWNTTDEFLSLRGGDWEEHAILLRNYFHWLDQEMQSGYRSYIVQGEGVPEGDTVYVLRMARGGMDAWYWNAATGRCFAKRDPSCPLRQVHALADGDNVWCNAQGSCVPDEVALDLENGSHWRALFTAKTPRSRFGELEPLNREVPEYTMPEDSRVNELREALQERLKEAVRTWRNSNARFLTSAGKHLRERLVDFEDQRLLGADVLEHDQAEVLARLGASDGFGFPLCMPFTDVQGVVEAIKNTVRGAPEGVPRVPSPLTLPAVHRPSTRPRCPASSSASRSSWCPTPAACSPCGSTWPPWSATASSRM